MSSASTTWLLLPVVLARTMWRSLLAMVWYARPTLCPCGAVERSHAPATDMASPPTAQAKAMKIKRAREEAAATAAEAAEKKRADKKARRAAAYEAKKAATSELTAAAKAEKQAAAAAAKLAGQKPRKWTAQVHEIF